MTLLYRLNLHRLQWTHTLLRFVSRLYRESSDLQDLLDQARAQCHAAEAQLTPMRQQLSEAQDALRTLTLSAQQASADATRYRVERDESREREATALRMLADKLNPIVDVLALRVLGQQVYGSLPETLHPDPREADRPATVGRGVQGKYVAREQTRKILEEIEHAQTAQRLKMQMGVQNPIQDEVNGTPV